MCVYHLAVRWKEKNTVSSPPKVLIVDDEERFRAIMCKRLNHRGLSAVTAGSGPEALEAVKNGRYDVVILDIRMPEINGVQVLSKLKKIEPLIEVIIMTAYASIDTAKEILRLGAYDYVLKPYDIDELVEKIEAAYERKVTRTDLASQAAREKKENV
jgi:DNA-binding NtrC family response regulator